MVKLVCFVKRKAGLSAEQFYDHWENVHGPLIAGTPELARHVVRYEQHRRTSHADWMGTAGFDGVTIQWLASPAALEAFVAEPAYLDVLAADEESFLDRDALVWMVTEEPLVPIPGLIEGPATSAGGG